MGDWQMLLVPTGYGYSYPESFDREREYDFKRLGDDEVMRFRMADQSPYFNVAGLMWRDPAARQPKP